MLSLLPLLDAITALVFYGFLLTVIMYGVLVTRRSSRFVVEYSREVLAVLRRINHNLEDIALSLRKNK
jgi:hypothetical protein